eukprot:6324228-Amphidinium_carterae.1
MVLKNKVELISVCSAQSRHFLWQSRSRSASILVSAQQQEDFTLTTTLFRRSASQTRYFFLLCFQSETVEDVTIHDCPVCFSSPASSSVKRHQSSIDSSAVLFLLKLDTPHITGVHQELLHELSCHSSFQTNFQPPLSQHSMVEWCW